MKTRKNISCFVVCDNITFFLAERKIRTKGAEYGKYDVIDRKEFERADYFYYCVQGKKKSCLFLPFILHIEKKVLLKN